MILGYLFFKFFANFLKPLKPKKMSSPGGLSMLFLASIPTPSDEALGRFVTCHLLMSTCPAVEGLVFFKLRDNWHLTLHQLQVHDTTI